MTLPPVSKRETGDQPRLYRGPVSRDTGVSLVDGWGRRNLGEGWGADGRGGPGETVDRGSSPRPSPPVLHSREEGPGVR